MEIGVKMAVDAPKETIWEHYINQEKRVLWEEDLEELQFDGEVKNGTTGRMKLKDMPAMDFVLSKIVDNEIYHDKYSIPNVGTVYFCHDITEEDGQLYVRHSIRSDEDNEIVLNVLTQISSDFPKVLWKLKKVVEA
ncbi:polyketide cyclase [Paenibacillus zeisoli]|uniref:Polyketide cyclase n=1 Tax=Paenibacillus zeisoli TaxID=2496267 RepID=A0A433XP82_9BACL|nr:polyketide cyclase [Paenibacillus zeisoli]RUT35778.1 polyketide cyclase [Paenibacillus zeisoli]